MTKDELIKQAQDGPHFQGREELVKHYQGKRLTQREAIKAHCYDCTGYYSGGAGDCEIHTCPLYPFAPYSAPDKKVKKSISDEQRERLAEAAKNRGKARAVTS